MVMYGNGEAWGGFVQIQMPCLLAMYHFVFSGVATCTYFTVITFWMCFVQWQKYVSNISMLYVGHKLILWNNQKTYKRVCVD